MSHFRADAEVAVQVLHENGGFSLTRDMQAVHGKAYFASHEGFGEEVPLEQFDADTIMGFRRKNFHHLAEEVSNIIGGWLNEGMVYLDLTRAFGDLQEALDFARANNQLAIWDGFNKREIIVDGHVSSAVTLLIAKLKAMSEHPIFSPSMVEDDTTSVEGEDDPDLQGWNGLLQRDLFQPAFASINPPAPAPNLTRMAGEWDDFDFAVPDDDSGEDAVYKWVWNEKEGLLLWLADGDGLPTHDSTIMQNWHRKRIDGADWLGYGVPDTDTIELESYRHGCPLKAFQAVKQQLANIEPSRHIVVPDYATGQDTGSASVTPAVDHTSRHRAASEWALATFGGEAPLVPVQRVHRIGGFSAKAMLYEAAQEADKKGCMIALYIPTEIGEKLAVKGGEEVEDMHITLAYFEDKGADRDDWHKAINIARSVAALHDPLSGKISGCGVFHMEDGDVLWAAPSIPGLAEFRTELVDAMNRSGFRVSDTYGYQPHITLKYDHKGKVPRLGEEGHELTFDGAHFVQEKERTKLGFHL